VKVEIYNVFENIIENGTFLLLRSCYFKGI